jgi:hypothetical protein
MRTTSWTAPLKSMVTTADKRTTGGTSYTKQENGAGNTVTDGGMNMSVAGTSNAIGTTMIMITAGTRE